MQDGEKEREEEEEERDKERVIGATERKHDIR